MDAATLPTRRQLKQERDDLIFKGHATRTEAGKHWANFEASGDPHDEQLWQDANADLKPIAHRIGELDNLLRTFAVDTLLNEAKS